ncbi:Transmembrane secretion effector [Micrococcales bacterium KH10]|nr:Transmembrane secretion effector [Micrococcales bacterium KH10]
MRFLADITPLRESADFRRLWWGQGVASIGHQITVITVSLEAYHLTGSTWAVGMIGLCELVPLIVFGLYGGAIVDRVDRRKAALLATVVLWLTTVALALHAWLDAEKIGILYGLVAIQAAAYAVNSPARTAITPRLVRAELLPAANALQGAVGNLAMTVGPMLGALLVAMASFAAAYGLDAILMTAAMWAIWRLPPILPLTEDEAASPEIASQEQTARRVRLPRGIASVWEGLRYLGTRPNVRMTFLVDLCAMIFAMPRVVFPAAGVLYLGGGEMTSGALITAIAVGGIVAMVFSGPVSRIHFHGRAIVWAIVGWALAILAFGFVLVAAGDTRPSGPVWWAITAAAVALAVAGACDSISAIFRQSVLQTATPDSMRGRLQGVFIVVVAGGPRVGDMTLGGGAELLSEGWVVVVGALLCLICLGLLVNANRGFLAYDARNPVP